MKVGWCGGTDFVVTGGYTLSFRGGDGGRSDRPTAFGLRTRLVLYGGELLLRLHDDVIHVRGLQLTKLPLRASALEGIRLCAHGAQPFPSWDQQSKLLDDAKLAATNRPR